MLLADDHVIRKVSRNHHGVMSPVTKIMWKIAACMFCKGKEFPDYAMLPHSRPSFLFGSDRQVRGHSPFHRQLPPIAILRHAKHDRD